MSRYLMFAVCSMHWLMTLQDAEGEGMTAIPTRPSMPPPPDSTAAAESLILTMASGDTGEWLRPIIKLGGAGDRFSDYLCVLCVNLPRISGQNSPDLLPKFRSLPIIQKRLLVLSTMFGGGGRQKKRPSVSPAIISALSIDPIHVLHLPKSPTTLSFTPPIEQNNSARKRGSLSGSGCCVVMLMPQPPSS